MAVLVTGGSGYLGQFVVQSLAADHKVGFIYSTNAPESSPQGSLAFKADLSSGEGLREAIKALGGIVAVVNCAALSQPVACENKPEAARAVNVPTQLLHVLEEQKQQSGKEALLIHLSTDQVYDGSKAFWEESDKCNPINMYGITKLEAEEAIKESWPHSVILRSSIIYGPLPPIKPVNRGLFLQFVESALRAGKETTFFDDEYRCPIFVNDIVKIIRAALTRFQDTPMSTAKVYNMGGPQRMSRVDMAETVAAVCGLSHEAIVPAPAASVNRGVASPADISMNSGLLKEELGITATSFADALTELGMGSSAK